MQMLWCRLVYLARKQSRDKINDYRNALDNGHHVVKSLVKEPNKELFVDWRPYLGHVWTANYDTRVELKTLQRAG